ncbi:helix-turn-helix transcriptional regulator [Bacillus sp. AGMB 02131]|uniref:Helix-turn-helix transcriptional regulator n=1 Tax=Peribacillus faecalis TaxID=2772559 RepID=A0A927CWP2_9BACI|nr:AraC family transcriptional regulator [Peribacillus faecalis]MBD3109142.1 helix-turn-helix transcriptional regulator [Peribacillus faecalis]
MKETHFLPLSIRDFEIYRVGKNIPEQVLLKKHNETGHISTSTETFFQLHSHDVFEFLILESGECEYFCEGKTYSLKKGDVMVIPPHAIHRALVKDFDQYERILISINPHLLLDFQYSSPILKENITFQKTNGNYMYQLDSKSFQKVVSLLNDIIKKVEEGKCTYSFTLQNLLFQALEIIFDPSLSKQCLSMNNGLDKRLASILEFIEVHLTDKDLSLDFVSESFHMNKYYFSHYFKGRMNLPFYRYVSLKRLSLALDMIKQNQLPMEQIAIKCGFLDYSSFYRLFKKEYMVSPKNLQKEFINRSLS